MGILFSDEEYTIMQGQYVAPALMPDINLRERAQDTLGDAANLQFQASTAQYSTDLYGAPRSALLYCSIVSGNLLRCIGTPTSADYGYHYVPLSVTNGVQTRSPTMRILIVPKLYTNDPYKHFTFTFDPPFLSAQGQRITSAADAGSHQITAVASRSGTSAQSTFNVIVTTPLP